MQKKSIYKYAAEAGLPTGFYLSALSACMLMSVRYPYLATLILPLSLGFPFYLWYILKTIAKAEPTYNKFSSLWLGGIYTVIFGTLICMFLSSLYVVFIEPSFVALSISNAIDVMESSPLAADYAATTSLMKEAMEAHLLPSGLEFLLTLAWFTCFAGSILSLILSFIITKSSGKVTRGISA